MTQNGQNMVVVYNDKRVLVPIGLPENEWHKGIPLTLDFGGVYPEPFNSQLVDELAKRGIESAADLSGKPNYESILRQAIQAVLKLNIRTVEQLIKGSDK